MAGATHPPLSALLLDAPQDGALGMADASCETAPRLRHIWEGRRTLIRVCSSAIALATLIALLLPKSYQSTTRLMPPDSDSSSSLAMVSALAARTGGVAGVAASDLLGTKSSGALFIGILQSRTVEDRIVERFGLRKAYSVALTEDASKLLSERTTISEDRMSGILTLTVTDRNPQRSAAIAQAYIEELNRLAGELSTSSAHRERIFLEERLQTVQRDLEQAEREFSQFASQNTAIDIPAQGKAMVDAAARLQGQLIAAQAQMEGLRQIYSDGNARVRESSAQVAELERQLDKIGGKDTVSGGAPESSPSLYPSIRKLPLLGVAYSDLYRRTRIEETVYETLTQQYELAKVQEAKELPSVKVLDVAQVPRKKSFPPRALIVIFGAVVSFFAGIVWVLARAEWNETDPRHPHKLLAIEMMRTVQARLASVSLRAREAKLSGFYRRVKWRRYDG